MSLTKLTRLASGRLLKSFPCHQPGVRPSITRLSVPVRAVIREYRRPGKLKEDTFRWQNVNFDFSRVLEELKRNMVLLRKELSDPWVGPQGKPILEHMLEQNRVVWEFKGPESLKQWIVSSDLEIGGKSEVSLKMGKNGQTCFLSGKLDSTPPRDGETRYSGYCTMRSKQPQVSLWTHALTFKMQMFVHKNWSKIEHKSSVPQRFLNKKNHYDWSSFNTLHLRVRGDGRPWMINIAPETYFSHQKDDIYCYFMYTRGGPYWQEVKVSSTNLGKPNMYQQSLFNLPVLDTILQVFPHKSREGARWPVCTLAGQGRVDMFH